MTPCAHAALAGMFTLHALFGFEARARALFRSNQIFRHFLENLPSRHHGHRLVTMKTNAPSIPAGRFKAECLALLDRVAATGETLVVTKRGRPVARILPFTEEAPRPLLGSVKELGDLVAPLSIAWDSEK